MKKHYIKGENFESSPQDATPVEVLKEVVIDESPCIVYKKANNSHTLRKLNVLEGVSVGENSTSDER